VPIFSQGFIERVRAASDIVDVVGASLPLKRAGTNFVALCPFHREKSPSFNVSPGRQIFHCFGCQTGGDVFGFVQKYENISFTEAVERLAERARIPIEHENNPAALHQRGIKDQLLKLHEAICTRWQQCLATEAAGQIARDYLTQRGVSADSVREFRIGAAPESWDDTVNWAKRHGFDLKLCQEAGLVIHKAESNRWYDRFRGRLMFPICDEQGRVIAFSGRILQGDEKSAKYVNSPETPLFTKGKVLFALDKAKRAILDAGHAIVCEGQLDTIACHAAGVRNVIAPQGTALTAAHGRILKRYVEEVILCFDGDKAGRNATIRSLDDCLGSGLAIRVASIPPPDDPDSYIRKAGADAFREVLGRAQSFFDFYLQHLITENDPATDRGRLAIIAGMGSKLQLTGNAVLIDTYAQRTSQRLGVSVDAVRTEFRKIRPAAPRPEPEDRPQPPAPSSRTAPASAPDAAPAQPSDPGYSEPDPSDDVPSAIAPEPPTRPAPNDLWLLKFLCHADSELLDWTIHHLDPQWIQHPITRTIVQCRINQSGGDLSITTLLAALDENDFARQLVTEAGSDQRAIANLPTQLADLTRRIRDAWIDRQIVLLGTHLADSSRSHEEHLTAMREQQQLRAWKRQPLAPLGDA